MNWGSQVVHVARKDLQHARWSIAAYGAATATFTAIICFWPRTESTSDWGILLIPLSMIVAAAIVQADSPTEVDAFWATRPLSRSAVAVAKLAAVGVGIVIPGLICQLALLRAFDVPPAAMPMALLTSAGVQGVLLLIAMALAALTRDLKAFVLAGVLVVIAGILAPYLPWMPLQAVELRPAPAALMSLLTPLAVFGTMLYQYLFRGKRFGRLVAIGVAALLIGAVPPVTAARRDLETGGASPSATVSEARITWEREPRDLQVTIDVPDRTPQDRISLVGARVFFAGHGGQRDSLVSGARSFLVGRDGQRESMFVPAYTVLSAPTGDAAGFRWLLTNGSGAYHVWIGDSTIAKLRNGGENLVIDGTLVVERPRAVARLPLDSGAAVTVRGSRFTYRGVRYTSGRALPTVEAMTIASPQQTDAITTGAAYSFALVNDSLAEAVEWTTDVSSTGSVTPPVPGILLAVRSTGFNYRMGLPGNRRLVDDAWLRGAHLAVFEWDRRERIPIRLEIDPRTIKDLAGPNAPK